MKVSRLALAVLLAAAVGVASADQVKVYEAPLTLPTYRIGAPEIMPYFNRIYPYTMYEKLTDEKYERTYKALWVENDYVKALVLPEIGGRLHGAQDKTNGYQFLYNQTTIKPGLVGMAGAWISGGVEWNFPHGHRPSGFRDTDYRIVENADGSKTAWTGEIDRVYGMRWAVGTTVYPGRNWVETKVRLFNCTPFTQSYQMWATAAVRTTLEYQAVIPGEIVTGHGKHQFFHWPINNGADMRYWKNIEPANSFFAWESDAPYFGGYSPEEKGGLVHYGDPAIVRGKKLWTWGTAPSGRIWEKILTDGDLPYFEPQAGAYSDNQPDYHWILPGETKVYSHFWFPVRDIGVYDFANLEGALNLDLDGGKAKFGWSPTGKNENAVVVVTSAGQEIFRKTINADPATPFLGEAKAPKGADLYSLHMTVLGTAGDTLLSFQHPVPDHPDLPTPAPRPERPADVKTGDELFLLGDYMEKFRNDERAMDYYNEALRRDPGDIRTNAAVGLRLLKQGQFQEALAHFDKALERDETFATARYYKGMAHLLLGQEELAERHLNRASYGLAYYASAHFDLAQLCASQSRYDKALEHIGRSLNGNGDNTEAYAVKALILNRQGRYEEALAVAEQAQLTDPLDFLSLTEKYFSLKNLGREDQAERAYDEALAISRLDSENYLELAVRYARCGQYAHALRILDILTGKTDDVSPMVYYYKAWYYHKLGDKEKAMAQLAKAATLSTKYVFPNRLESFPVLEYAMASNPGDGHASYLLGDLLRQSFRPAEALAAWQKSVELDPGNAVAWRNIGVALSDKGDLAAAQKAYLSAVKADPEAAMALQELDEVNEKLGLGRQERIALLEQHMDAVGYRDPLLKRLISLYVQTGRNDDALSWLSDHHFHSWEGRYDIHQYWVESHLSKGDLEMEAGKYAQALEHFQLSLTYPFNLEVAEQPRAVQARKNYKLATALEALGRKKEARQAYEQVLADEKKMRVDNADQYFRGKALEKLGRKQEGQAVYQAMLAALDRDKSGDTGWQPEDEPNFDPRRNSEAIWHFKRALALEGLGRSAEADEEQAKATGEDPIVALRAFSPPRAGW